MIFSLRTGESKSNLDLI